MQLYTFSYCCNANCLKICSTIKPEWPRQDARWPSVAWLVAWETHGNQICQPLKWIFVQLLYYANTLCIGVKKVQLLSWRTHLVVQLEGFPPSVREFEMDSNLWLLYSHTSRPLTCFCSSNSIYACHFQWWYWEGDSPEEETVTLQFWLWQSESDPFESDPLRVTLPLRPYVRSPNYGLTRHWASIPWGTLRMWAGYVKTCHKYFSTVSQA